MYVPNGIRASELIRKLQAAIAEHGDQQCFVGGGDYPEGVSGVYFAEKGDAYIPKGSFKID